MKELKRTRYTRGTLKEFLEKDRYYNCIAHHTIKTIPESKLKKRVYTCQETTSRVIKLDNYIVKLYEGGILDRLMAPENDEINLRLTPLAKRAFANIFIKGKEPIRHPKISKEEKLILINEC